MTIDEAIKHCLEVAEKNENDVEVYEVLAKNHKNTYSKLTAIKYATDCAECAAEHRQLAEWLTELKELREENKVLMQECDRLIKEKGELLSKVSGGDVLRICQLENQLQAELDNSHCLEIELTEAKRLLKAAVEDIHELLCDKKNLDGNGQSCNICSYIEWCPCCKECTIREDLRNWRYADEALKLIGGSENG